MKVWARWPRALYVDLDVCQHTFTYNADGTVATDTATDGFSTFLKTYTYTNGQMTGETSWTQTA